MRQTKTPVDIEMEVDIERTDLGYMVRFHTSGVGLESYKSIESVVRDVAKNNLKLTIDLTQVEYGNGDFFNYLAAEYLRAKPKGEKLEAVRAMQDNLTLIVNQGSRVYETSHQIMPGLVKYDFKKDAS